MKRRANEQKIKSIEAIEQSGLQFARRLGARLFTTEELSKKIEKILSDEINEVF